MKNLENECGLSYLDVFEQRVSAAVLELTRAVENGNAFSASSKSPLFVFKSDGSNDPQEQGNIVIVIHGNNNISNNRSQAAHEHLGSSAPDTKSDTSSKRRRKVRSPDRRRIAEESDKESSRNGPNGAVAEPSAETQTMSPVRSTGVAEKQPAPSSPTTPRREKEKVSTEKCDIKVASPVRAGKDKAEPAKVLKSSVSPARSKGSKATDKMKNPAKPRPAALALEVKSKPEKPKQTDESESEDETSNPRSEDEEAEMERRINQKAQEMLRKVEMMQNQDLQRSQHAAEKIARQTSGDHSERAPEKAVLQEPARTTEKQASKPKAGQGKEADPARAGASVSDKENAEDMRKIMPDVVMDDHCTVQSDLDVSECSSEDDDPHGVEVESHGDDDEEESVSGQNGKNGVKKEESEQKPKRSSRLAEAAKKPRDSFKLNSISDMNKLKKLVGMEPKPEHMSGDDASSSSGGEQSAYSASESSSSSDESSSVNKKPNPWAKVKTLAFGLSAMRPGAIRGNSFDSTDGLGKHIAEERAKKEAESKVKTGGAAEAQPDSDLKPKDPSPKDQSNQAPKASLTKSKAQFWEKPANAAAASEPPMSSKAAPKGKWKPPSQVKQEKLPDNSNLPPHAKRPELIRGFSHDSNDPNSFLKMRSKKQHQGSRRASLTDLMDKDRKAATEDAGTMPTKQGGTRRSSLTDLMDKDRKAALESLEDSNAMSQSQHISSSWMTPTVDPSVDPSTLSQSVHNPPTAARSHVGTTATGYGGGANVGGPRRLSHSHHNRGLLEQPARSTQPAWKKATTSNPASAINLATPTAHKPKLAYQGNMPGVSPLVGKPKLTNGYNSVSRGHPSPGAANWRKQQSSVLPGRSPAVGKPKLSITGPNRNGQGSPVTATKPTYRVGKSPYSTAGGTNGVQQPAAAGGDDSQPAWAGKVKLRSTKRGSLIKTGEDSVPSLKPLA